MTTSPDAIEIRTDSFPSDLELNELFRAAWENHKPGRFQRTLRTCLVHLTVHADNRLVGFVKIASDGDTHAFLLDPTVHPDFRRDGLGTKLVKAAADAARERGATWLHVDFEPHLESFYRACGFTHTTAGLRKL